MESVPAAEYLIRQRHLAEILANILIVIAKIVNYLKILPLAILMNTILKLSTEYLAINRQKHYAVDANIFGTAI